MSEHVRLARTWRSAAFAASLAMCSLAAVACGGAGHTPGEAVRNELCPNAGNVVFRTAPREPGQSPRLRWEVPAGSAAEIDGNKVAGTGGYVPIDFSSHPPSGTGDDGRPVHVYALTVKKEGCENYETRITFTPVQK